VLCLVGDLLGSLAARDLKARCAAGLDHDSERWAARKRVLTEESSSRWAGSITKATHDQWALARRGQLAHIQSVQVGIETITHRLSLPMGEKGSKHAPGGYRSRQEWFVKSRRLHLHEDRLQAARADREAGVVHVVRGGKRLLNARHHLDTAQLTEPEWRKRWQAGRRFLHADGESGKRYGNETIRVTDDGEVSLKLPAPLAHLANAPHGRYVLAARVSFAHRGEQCADRVTANRAVAHRIHEDTVRGRWYLTASWTNPPVTLVPLEAARARGLVGVDTNADHLAARRLDHHGNPVGEPLRFGCDLSSTASHRDAQLRHALIRLLHWAKHHGLAIAIENLDFTAETTREKHGRRERFRNLISGMPVSKLRARLVSMAAELGIAIIAVDPAYTSKWGAQHWQKPLTSSNRKTTRHDAAAVAIGRRALGHPIRMGVPPRPLRHWGRTAPPRTHQSDGCGHRTVQARPGAPGREAVPISGLRPRAAPASPDHGHDPSAPDAARTRWTRTPNTVRGVRLSMSPGNRTHSRSVSRNGSFCARPRRRCGPRPVTPMRGLLRRSLRPWPPPTGRRVRW
jgi:IS605 OrfB family transposase